MEELHKMIQALSKDEKREFKLHASVYKNSKESNHIKLFDFLERMKEYDAKLIQKKINENAFGKQFPITKQKLWDNLLESLSNSSRDTTIRRQISRDIDQIDILLEYGCFKLAKRKILHALKNAMAIDHHVSIMKLCHQYQFVVIDSFLKNEPYEWKYVYDVPTASAQKFQFHMHFFKANTMLKEIILQSKFDPEKGSKSKQIEDIVKNMLDIKVPEELETIQVRYNRFMSYNLYYYHTHQPEKMLESSKEMVAEFDRNAVHLKENIKGYISVLFNLVLGYKDTRDWVNFSFYLEKLKNAVYNEPTVFKHYFISLQNLRLQGLYYLDQMDKFDELYRESMQYMDDDNGHSSHVRYFFNLLTTKLFFNRQDYKKALEVCNQLRNTTSKEIYEINAAAYIIFMFIHLALENFDVVAHHIDYLRKYLEKWDYLDEMDKILIDFFTRSVENPQPRAIRQHFAQVWETLQQFKAMPKFYNYFEFFDAESWIKSQA